MLLGADVFYRLLCVGQIPLGNGELLLQKTRLGWIVTGSLSINSKKQVECKLLSSSYCDIQAQLERFWSLEEMSLKSKPLTGDDILCERIFTENTMGLSHNFFLFHNYKDGLKILYLYFFVFKNIKSK